MNFDNYLKTILTLLNFLSNKKINFDDYLNNKDYLSIETYDSNKQISKFLFKKHNLEAVLFKNYNFKNQISEISFISQNHFNFIQKDQICLGLKNDLKIILTNKKISLNILYIFENSNFNFRFIYNFNKNLDKYTLEVFKVCKETFKIQLSDIDTFNSYTLKEVLKYNLDYEKIIPYYNYTTVLNFQDPLIKNQIALLDLINYNWLNIFLL